MARRLWFVLVCSLAAAWIFLVQATPSAMAQNGAEIQTGTAGAASDLPTSLNSMTSLTGGWIDAKPYRSMMPGKVQGVEGLDIDILADVLHMVGVEAHLRRQPWQDQLEDLVAGQGDIAVGAFRPANGDDRFHYSLPYRWARISFYVRKTERDLHDTSDVAQLMAGQLEFRVGIIPGRLFQDPALNSAIEKAIQEGRAVYASSDEENLKNLLDGRIDGFVGDRLSVFTASLEGGMKFQAAEFVLPGISTVHFIFSKKTVTPETVAIIDQAIKTLEDQGVLKKRIHSSAYNVMLGFLLDADLHKLLAIVGTIAFAVSGVLIAYRENFTFFGALVLSALPALGGGALRDILLSRHPLGVVSSPLYLCLVGATVLVGFGVILAMRLLARKGWRISTSQRTPRFLTMANVQELSDSLGMAVFTLSGLAVAISSDADPLWLWGPIAAMLSAAGGGILRDIVRQSGQVGTLKTEFYAEVPLLWGFAFSLFLMTRPVVLTPEEIRVAIFVTIAGVFVTRMAVVMLGIRPFPFKWPPDRP